MPNTSDVGNVGKPAVKCQECGKVIVTPRTDVRIVEVGKCECGGKFRSLESFRVRE